MYDDISATNTLLMVVSTGMILLMQAGFALVENGSVRAKNSKNILIKNMFDVCIGALLFWLFGYGVAFSFKSFSVTETLGAAGFDHARSVDHYAMWIFQFSFAATASTIVSGSLAERTKLPTYILFSGIMTGLIYPVVVSWTWGGGWLGQNDFADFAGTGIVHMVGGVAGFVGTAIIGPRHAGDKSKKVDMSDDKEAKILAEKVEDRNGFLQFLNEEANSTAHYEPASTPFVVIGTFILWVSWLFFNGGSTVDMFQPRVVGTPKIMMNTIIAGATGGLVAVILKPVFFRTYTSYMTYDIAALCNGVLGGLVSITGACNNVQPWAAFLIGMIGGVVYCAGARLCIKLNVDDPIEASAVHGFCGMWGLVAVGLFDNTKGVLYGDLDAEDALTQRWQFLGWQIIGLIAIVLWTSLMSGIFFGLARKCGKLRVSLVEEVLGLDISEMDHDAILHIN